MIKTEIAKIKIALDSESTGFWAERAAEYVSDYDHPDMTIRCRAVEEIIPCGALRKKYTAARIYEQDGRTVIYNLEGGNVVRSLSFADGYSHADIELKGTHDLALREYVAANEAFNNRVIFGGGIILHSSAIRAGGKGIAFSALSGTGKSTHARLWKSCHGEDVAYINDDKPAVLFESDRPILYGNPWSGKTDINSNISAPLAAVVFLKQAPYNKAEEISPADAYFNLLEQTYRPYYDGDIGRRSIDSIERLLDKTRFYVLQCSISAEAVETIKNLLERDNVL
ncbi:MAG: hypothetical protein FWH14_03410 [Oscillospiraceae bacterium]|nr:hypothetical protein [Oscillospiraceae bacterium]